MENIPVTEHYKDVFSTKDGLHICIERSQNFKKPPGKKLLYIRNDASFRYYVLFIKKDLTILPKLYIALEHFTGQQDYSYDDYSGSYGFNFLLKVSKNDRSDHFLLKIYHNNSHIEFSLYQEVPDTDPRDEQYIHSADESLFSTNEIDLFCIPFCEQMIENLEKSAFMPKAFFKKSDSNLVLFGYNENKYFAKEYKNHDEYRREKKELLFSIYGIEKQLEEC